MLAITNPPAGWQDYTPLTIITDETTLDDSTDYLIQNQDLSNRTLVRLLGGRNIVVMGCDRSGTSSTTPAGEGRFAFEFRDEPTTTARVIHVEGCRIQGNLSQGFLLNCSTADVQLVNNRMYEPDAPCRFLNCDDRDGTNGLTANSPDLIQSYAGYGGRIYGFNSLTIDGLTAWAGYRGLFFEQLANSSLGSVTMRRMDLHQGAFIGLELDLAQGVEYFGGGLLWFETDTTTYQIGDDCYFEVLPTSLIQNGNDYKTRFWDGSSYVAVANPGGGDLADAFQPSGSAVMNLTEDEATFNLAYVTGTAYAWSPEVGNFVTTSVGIGYARPIELVPIAPPLEGGAGRGPGQVTLGCAYSYDVVITARDLATYAAQVNWSSLSWSRVLDEVSTATVTVPDAFGGLRCNIEMGSEIRPWRFGLRIERNGQLVWTGPITSVTRPERDGAGADYVEIAASDVMAWMGKRTTNTSQLYTDHDGGTVFKGVLDDATQFDNLFGLHCPPFVTGYTMTREILALDFEYTLDVLTELANSAVDYFVCGNELVVYDLGSRGWFTMRDGVKTRFTRTTDPYGRHIYGLFTDEAYTARPGFTIDGMGQANDVIVPGADSGEAGFRRHWQASDIDLLDGILTYVDVSTLYRPRPEDLDPTTAFYVFQEQANSTLAAKNGPVVIFSGGVLSPSAPVTVDGLLPGSLWGMDLAEMGVGQLLDVQRLKRVDVNVSLSGSGIVEQVAPTLIPLGTDESQAA